MSRIQAIKNHLEVSYKLEAAMKDVLNGEKDVQAAAISYRLNRKMFYRKMNVITKMKKYIALKYKFELAVTEYLNKRATIKGAANHYGINQRILTKEIEYFERHSTLGTAEYEYDKPIQSKGFFTLREELLLLKDLFYWKNMFQPYCFCQLCAMDRLLSLADQYAKNNGREHLKRWNKTTERTKLRWLTDFEMRFSFFISKNFRPNCMKVPTISQAKLRNRSKSLLVSKSIYNHSGSKEKDFDQSRIYNVKDTSTQTIRKITSAVSDNVNDQPLDLRTRFQTTLKEEN